MTNPKIEDNPAPSADVAGLQQELRLVKLPALDRERMRALLGEVGKLPEPFRGQVMPAFDDVLEIYGERVSALGKCTDRLRSQAERHVALLGRLEKMGQLSTEDLEELRKDLRQLSQE